MTEVVVLKEADVLEYIKKSRTYLGKSGFQLQCRSGVYGENPNNAIERLAKKMGVKTGIIRQLVHQLMARHKVAFAHERLYVMQLKPASPKGQRVSLLNSKLAPTPDANEAILDLLPPSKEYLATVYADEFAAMPTSTN